MVEHFVSALYSPDVSGQHMERSLGRLARDVSGPLRLTPMDNKLTCIYRHTVIHTNAMLLAILAALLAGALRISLVGFVTS